MNLYLVSESADGYRLERLGTALALPAAISAAHRICTSTLSRLAAQGTAEACVCCLLSVAASQDIGSVYAHACKSQGYTQHSRPRGQTFLAAVTQLSRSSHAALMQLSRGSRDGEGHHVLAPHINECDLFVAAPQPVTYMVAKHE